MELFIALNTDNDARWYGYGKGAGHALMIPDGFFGDPLSGATGETLCGKSLDMSRLTEKSGSEAQCKACAKRLTDALLERARAAKSAMDKFCEPVAMEEGPGGAPVAVETLESETAAPGTDSGSVFVTVDGKCAREVAGEDGAVSLKAIHGRSRITPVDGSVSVNGDGAEVGVCPQCHREVKLTGSGFIGTHYPAKLGKSPIMSEQAVTDVVADAAERKRAAEIDTERAAAEEEEREFRAPVAENVRRASGDQGTEATRGAAMVQGADMPPVQPNSGHASTWDGGIGSARPDRKVIDEPKHGGRYGYFTKEEYDALSRTAQRQYWRNVNKFEKQAKGAREALRAKEVATGKAIPAGERRKARKAAKVGSGVTGHRVGYGHPGIGHGKSAEESRAMA
ncbi:hypothetical protein [Streptomyces sp. 5-10]|uniref:hypothetical protein n=1 Tax=Streptomyces sp. 5-10 TaxID=878925 RepID=UPI00168B12F7|nr:hypothetical protein [Streptomyces sp. 5-10]MBD3004562.1 hypothetical protein [Streptomyces sp. 5-10]